MMPRSDPDPRCAPRPASVPVLKLARRRPEAQIGGKTVPLTWQAWQLLGFLSEAPGLPVSNDQLCNRFGLPLDHNGCNGHILQIVHRTRDVLQGAGYPHLIETVPGMGYRLRMPR